MYVPRRLVRATAAVPVPVVGAVVVVVRFGLGRTTVARVGVGLALPTSGTAVVAARDGRLVPRSTEWDRVRSGGRDVAGRMTEGIAWLAVREMVTDDEEEDDDDEVTRGVRGCGATVNGRETVDKAFVPGVGGTVNGRTRPLGLVGLTVPPSPPRIEESWRVKMVGGRELPRRNGEGLDGRGGDGDGGARSPVIRYGALEPCPYA